MTSLIVTAVLSAIMITPTGLVTGRLLAEKKRKLFHLEMVHEEMRRQLHEIRLRNESVRGNLEILTKVWGQKQREVEFLEDER